MSESYKFQDVDKHFTFSVSMDFLEACPEPEKEKLSALLEKYYVFKYFHNESGPALIRHMDGRKEYWVKGKSVNHEDPVGVTKMQHKDEFNQSLESLVDDDSQD